MIIKYKLQWESADKKSKQFVGDIIDESENKQFCYYMNINGTWITDYILLYEKKTFKDITYTEIGKEIINIIKKQEK